MEKWPEEVFDGVRDPVSINFYLIRIHSLLGKIDREFSRNTNPSCRVGLINAEKDILFKLIEIQNSIACKKDLMKRIDNLEKKLHSLELDGKKKGGKCG